MNNILNICKYQMYQGFVGRLYVTPHMYLLGEKKQNLHKLTFLIDIQKLVIFMYSKFNGCKFSTIYDLIRIEHLNSILNSIKMFKITYIFL